MCRLVNGQYSAARFWVHARLDARLLEAKALAHSDGQALEAAELLQQLLSARSIDVGCVDAVLVALDGDDVCLGLVLAGWA